MDPSLIILTAPHIAKTNNSLIVQSSFVRYIQYVTQANTNKINGDNINKLIESGWFLVGALHETNRTRLRLSFVFQQSTKMVHIVFMNVVLISLYVYFFGITSVDRFLEESIVTIKKTEDISSTSLDVKPGHMSNKA